MPVYLVKDGKTIHQASVDLFCFEVGQVVVLDFRNESTGINSSQTYIIERISHWFDIAQSEERYDCLHCVLLHVKDEDTVFNTPDGFTTA